MHKRILPACLAAFAAISLIAGCGGGGGNASAPTLPGVAKTAAPGAGSPNGSGQKATASISIRIPIVAKSGSSKVRTKYVSPNTQSIVLYSSALNGGAAFAIPLTTSSGNCTLETATPPSYYQCTANAGFDVGGPYALSVQTFASTNGSGQALSENSVSGINIVANQANPISLSLNGIATTMSFALVPVDANEDGTTQTIVPTFSFQDASGATIVGPGTLEDSQGTALVPSISSNDSSGNTALTGSYSAGYSVSYNGTAMTSPQFTATAGDSGFIADSTKTLTLGGVVSNGNFATGDLTGWTKCTIGHADYAAPVSPSPLPMQTPPNGQTFTPNPGATVSAYLAANGTVAAPLGSLAVANPGSTPATTDVPSLGTIPAAVSPNAALTGSTNAEAAGQQGICTTFTPTTSNYYLSFYVYEGGTAYKFSTSDQEADVLNTGGTAVQKTLFAEENCFYDAASGAGLGETTPYASSCAPSGDDGYVTVSTPPPTPSPYQDYQGGYWTPRGPYNLSAFADTPITVFMGVWETTTGTGSYGNFMYVGDVALGASSTCCEAVPSSVHRRAVAPSQSIRRH